MLYVNYISNKYIYDTLIHIWYTNLITDAHVKKRFLMDDCQIPWHLLRGNTLEDEQPTK